MSMPRLLSLYGTPSNIGPLFIRLSAALLQPFLEEQFSLIQSINEWEMQVISRKRHFSLLWILWMPRVHVRPNLGLFLAELI